MVEIMVTEQRMPAGNSTYKKLAVQCSVGTFVVNQSLVLRINICGQNCQLLLAAKRWAKFAETHHNYENVLNY